MTLAPDNRIAITAQALIAAAEAEENLSAAYMQRDQETNRANWAEAEVQRLKTTLRELRADLVVEAKWREHLLRRLRKAGGQP